MLPPLEGSSVARGRCPFCITSWRSARVGSFPDAQAVFLYLVSTLVFAVPDFRCEWTGSVRNNGFRIREIEQPCRNKHRKHSRVRAIFTTIGSVEPTHPSCKRYDPNRRALTCSHHPSMQHPRKHADLRGLGLHSVQSRTQTNIHCFAVV